MELQTQQETGHPRVHLSTLGFPNVTHSPRLLIHLLSSTGNVFLWLMV